MLLKTDRLYLREMTGSDYPALCRILMDPEVMYAYGGAFSDEEARVWFNKQLQNYEALGFGLWAAVLTDTEEMIGQCGLTMQPVRGRQVLEIGYLFQKLFWRCGYATEAVAACKEYAFTRLDAPEVFSIIRDTNIASQNVAIRNGMVKIDAFIKHYRGVDMPHFLFRVKRDSPG